MIDNGSDKLLWHGQIKRVLTIFSGWPCFLIPIVQVSEMSNIQYVQRVDHHGLIVAFDPFIKEGYVIELSKPILVEVGSNEILACLDPFGRPAVGTRDEIKPRVSNWVRQIESPIERLNFAQAFGISEIVKTAAAAAFVLKTKDWDKDRAAKWLIRIAIVPELTRQLAKQARISDPFRELRPLIELQGSRLMVKWRSDKLDLNYSSVDFEEIFSKHSKFIKDTTGYSVSFSIYSPPLRKMLDLRVEDALETLSGLARQEQRLSYIISELLEDRDVGMALIDQHSDRAGFARKAIEKIGEYVDRNQRAQVFEQQIMRAIKLTLRDAYSFQRKKLLPEMSHFLGKDNPLVRGVFNL